MCWVSVLLTLEPSLSVINYEILKCLRLLHKVKSLLKTLCYVKKIMKHCCLLSSRKLALFYRYLCLIRVCLVIFLNFLWFLPGARVLFFLCSFGKIGTFYLSANVYFFLFKTVCTSCKVEQHFKLVACGAKSKSSKYNVFSNSTWKFVSCLVVTNWDLN